MSQQTEVTAGFPMACINLGITHEVFVNFLDDIQLEMAT